ncbi:MAG: hypothetical protein WBX25_13390 [Rhodomicrobium sp.]
MSESSKDPENPGNPQSPDSSGPASGSRKDSLFADSVITKEAYFEACGEYLKLHGDMLDTINFSDRQLFAAAP